jgi:peptidylprolyl isomerase
VVIVLIALGVIVWLIATSRGAEAPANNMTSAAAPQMPARGRLLPSGLRFEAISEGSGPLIRMSDTVLLRYELHAVGRADLIDGDINAPQPVPLSPATTVPGFAEALTLMRAGGEARFWVPPNLGYGDQASGPIGPNDILEFHVKVERIASAGQRAPSADSNTISEADLQNIMAAINAAEPAGGR